MVNNKTAVARPERSSFPSVFYAVNLMEIFERIAWYGFFTVSSLYITAPKMDGGLGYSDSTRGMIQGIIPFFLYLIPVLTGALGDRYTYKKMFLIAFIIMAPSYYMLGQTTELWQFVAVFMMVAIGAATFKPLVVGTISRVTDNSNRGLGFGIFYMMVNIGGFIGPLLAGQLRDISWDYVLTMGAIATVINILLLLLFFKEPTANSAKSEKQQNVFKDIQDVLGNGRFALLIIPIIIVLVASGKFIDWTTTAMFIGGWFLFHFIWNYFASDVSGHHWSMQKIKVGNGPFLLYLIVMTGFWIIYYQIFLTMPVYIRDYIDTSHAVQSIAQWSPMMADYISVVKTESLTRAILQIIQQPEFVVNPESIQTTKLAMNHYKVMIPTSEISTAFNQLLKVTTAEQAIAAQIIAERWATSFRQIAPEYIVSFNFLSIIIFQIAVSLYAEKKNAFNIIIGGTLLIAISYFVTGFAYAVNLGVLMVVITIIGFSFGEMMVSPKSQDYIAGIMPKDKAGMVMGYYFVCMALGSLFSGVISGAAYETFAVEMDKPEWVWYLFSGIGLITIALLILFKIYVTPRLENQQA